MAKLTALQVKSLKQPGRFGDGGGLYLVVRPTGSKSWIQRIVVDGKRRDIGLGGFPAVSLAAARQRATGNLTAVAEGRDPQAERQQRRALPTFRDTAAAYVKAYRARWRNPKTETAWRGSFENHANPVIGDMRIDRITRADVLATLRPIWTTKIEAGRKLRQRIRAVFAYAMAHGDIQINPAGELIDAALPKMPAVREHFRALPYQEVAPVLAAVDDSGANLSTRLCFQFVVLTAARSGEARGATWAEIDLQGATWTIPGERMKSGAEHRVPLSAQALDVLGRAEYIRDGSDLVFPSALRPGRPLSDMTLTKLLRCLGLSDRATVHGFRTTFKTWCMERTNTPWAVGEAALAHSLGNSTEMAYARSDLFDKRRALMQEWAGYSLDGIKPGMYS